MHNEREVHGNESPAGEAHVEPSPVRHDPSPPLPQSSAPTHDNPSAGGQPRLAASAELNAGRDVNGQDEPGIQGDGTGRKRRRRRRRRGGAGGQPGDPGSNGVPTGATSPDGQPHQPHQPHQQQQQQHRGNAQPQVQLREVEGVLEIDSRGNGALRRLDKNLLPWQDDADVPKALIQQLRLRPGWMLKAQAVYRNNRWSVTKVDGAEGRSLQDAQQLPDFAHLTSVDPIERIRLETTSKEYTTRVLDLIAPIGFGQRGLIVAPPRTGKTMILQRLAHAVSENHPKAHLIVLLVDERPEEVTDMRRSVRGDVLASSSDRPTSEHLRITEIALERSRRLVEQGQDVVILLDSITRLARAYNKEVESSGRTLTGGVDAKALERPKRIFGSARKAEEGGSLTIMGTALVDTGSRMDEVIFEEFKGTGNMEITLDRALAEKRIWPAINIPASGTRKEEKLFSPNEMEKVRKLRQALFAMKPIEAMEKLLQKLAEFRSNGEFLDAI